MMMLPGQPPAPPDWLLPPASQPSPRASDNCREEERSEAMKEVTAVSLTSTRCCCDQTLTLYCCHQPVTVSLQWICSELSLKAARPTECVQCVFNVWLWRTQQECSVWSCWFKRWMLHTHTHTPCTKCVLSVWISESSLSQLLSLNAEQTLMLTTYN